MIAEHIRDAAATAVIFGFFASIWFGWAHEDPPPIWRRPLTVAAITCMVTAVVGGLLTWRHWRDGTAFDPDTSRTFGIVVGIEFAVAGIGGGLLAWLRRTALTPAWIAFVVGVHLFPVATLIDYPAVHVVAALTALAAVAGVPIARARRLTPSAVVGAAVGTVLLAAALFSLATVAFGY